MDNAINPIAGTAIFNPDFIESVVTLLIVIRALGTEIKPGSEYCYPE